MRSLGYGRFARAERIYALVPLDQPDRGDGRRTCVHVDGMDEPIVASRSERRSSRDRAGADRRRPASRASAAVRPGQETALAVGSRFAR